MDSAFLLVDNFSDRGRRGDRGPPMGALIIHGMGIAIHGIHLSTCIQNPTPQLKSAWYLKPTDRNTRFLLAKRYPVPLLELHEGGRFIMPVIRLYQTTSMRALNGANQERWLPSTKPSWPFFQSWIGSREMSSMRYIRVWMIDDNLVFCRLWYLDFVRDPMKNSGP